MTFTLTDQMQEIVDEQQRLGAKPIESLEPHAARAQPTPADAVISLTEKKLGTFKPLPVAGVEERHIAGPMPDGTLIRIYRPKLAAFQKAKDAVSPSAGQPILIYVHGGGWVIADIDAYDGSARALANLSRAIVVSVEYRKGPESPFPAGHDDVLSATQWIMANAEKLGGDRSRIAIAGESAGGNMAASTCLELLKAGKPTPIFELLVYPVTDLAHDEWDSYEQAKGARPLSTEMLGWFGEHAVPEGSEADPRLSILHADEELLRQLPPTHVVLAEADPLRDQAHAFADKLSVLGVKTTVDFYPGVTHEFFGMAPLLPDADKAQNTAAKFLRMAFHGDVEDEFEADRVSAPTA